MGRRGPAPRPTVLRLLEGNPARRPLSEAEPKPPSIVPDCPKGLSRLARREWRRVTKELEALGMLTELDMTMLALYCHNWSEFVECEKIIKAKGRVYPAGADIKTRPEVNQSYRAQRQIMALSHHFGLSPGARSRINLIKEKTTDELDDLIGATG